MVKNIQPSMMVYLPQKGVVHGIVMCSKWDNMIFYRGQSYHSYIMGKFYSNMVNRKDENGLFVFTTVINGRNVFVDVDILYKAFRIEPEFIPQPCINFFEKFIFDRKEFETYVTFFCDSELPPALCVENCGIILEHFTPDYQQLVIIVRANILLQPRNDKFFDFVDLKVMYQLVTNSVEFNVLYVILINMFLAFQQDFMPYGLLLTSVFELFHISMPRMFAERIEYIGVEELVVPKVPLKDIKPYRFTLIDKTMEEVSHDFVRANELLRNVITKIKDKFEDNNKEIRGLKDKLIEVCEKLAKVENELESAKKASDTRLQIANLNEMIVDNELVAIGVGAQDDLPELAVFNTELGFVVAVKEAMS